jgi:hypothetical protein
MGEEFVVKLEHNTISGRKRVYVGADRGRCFHIEYHRIYLKELCMGSLVHVYGVANQ